MSDTNINSGDCREHGTPYAVECKKCEASDSRPPSCSLPLWSDCETAVDERNPTPLEKFIYDNEPGGSNEARQWRLDLLHVLQANS